MKLKTRSYKVKQKRDSSIRLFCIKPRHKRSD